MARQPSPAARTSLYRLTGVKTLIDAIQEKYLDGAFTATKVTVGGREALLVRGVMATPAVSWGPTLHRLTGETIDLGNITAAAVLLSRITAPDASNASTSDSQDASSNSDDEEPEHEDVAWALTYGMGFQLLTQGGVSHFLATVEPLSSRLTHSKSDTRLLLDTPFK